MLLFFTCDVFVLGKALHAYAHFESVQPKNGTQKKQTLVHTMVEKASLRRLRKK